MFKSVFVSRFIVKVHCGGGAQKAACDRERVMKKLTTGHTETLTRRECLTHHLTIITFNFNHAKICHLDSCSAFRLMALASAVSITVSTSAKRNVDFADLRRHDETISVLWRHVPMEGEADRG